MDNHENPNCLYKLTVPALYKYLRKIRGFVKKAAKSSGFNDADVYKIQLAVDEACSNIIEHAYTADNPGEIQCSCECEDDELIITLVDYGKSFDPDRIEPPDLHSSLKDRKTGGLGLYFIHQLMDEVTFTIKSGEELPQNIGMVGHPANILVMVKRRTKAK